MKHRLEKQNFSNLKTKCSVLGWNFEKNSENVCLVLSLHAKCIYLLPIGI